MTEKNSSKKKKNSFFFKLQSKLRLCGEINAFSD